MTLPLSNCALRAASAARGPVVRSIVPRPSAADAAAVAASSSLRSATTTSVACHRSWRQHRCQSGTTITSLYLTPTTPSPPTRLAFASSPRGTRRSFSTAVAAEYSEEEDDDDKERGRGDGDMPRLRALRERLRVEKYSEGNDGGGSVRSDLRPSGDARASERTAPSPVKIPLAVPFTDRGVDDNVLTDTFGRHHNYLRISLAERCNLRCKYCMPPEGVPLQHSSELLTDDEIARLVGTFARNGVDKVRLTGGEPLLRPNLAELVRTISSTLASGGATGSNDRGELPSVGITTNGISLSRKIVPLVDAGLTGVNVSLDTLRTDRFLEITRRNGLDKVSRAIDDCRDAFRNRYGSVRTGVDGTGGSRIKVNCVVMKGFNDDELGDFVRAAGDRWGEEVDVRFIEWMPFDDNGWNKGRFVSYHDMIDRLGDEMRMERVEDGPNDTTKWWRRADGGRSRVGFITSMSEHFCSTCNRLRITADGKIKTCLFGSNEREVSLRDVLRRERGDGEEEAREDELERVIRGAVTRKTFALGGHGSAENIAKAGNNRPMTLIGG